MTQFIPKLQSILINLNFAIDDDDAGMPFARYDRLEHQLCDFIVEHRPTQNQIDELTEFSDLYRVYNVENIINANVPKLITQS